MGQKKKEKLYFLEYLSVDFFLMLSKVRIHDTQFAEAKNRKIMKYVQIKTSRTKLDGCYLYLLKWP